MYSDSAAIYAAGQEISPTLSSTGSRGCSIFCTFVAHSANSHSKHASLAFPLGRHGGCGTCWVTGRSTSAISGRSYPSRKPRWTRQRALGGYGLRVVASTCPSMTLKFHGSLSRPERTAFQSRSEEHTSELQSRGHLVCRLLL